MSLPENLRFTKEHEWVRLEGNRAYIGITDYAQSELGDIVFIELPEIDDEFETGDQLGIVESVKAVSDIHVPLSGRVVAINDALEDNPELVNEDAYEAWVAVLEISNPDEFAALLTAEQYKDLI